ncbi:hypothetical protein ACWCP6_04450 [Streptomyces sp. NPDC002004]
MTDVRRQLRSGTVVLGGMGILAAALTACSSEPDKRCVDRDSYDVAKGYKVIADRNCNGSGSSVKSNADDAWYYGGDKKQGWVYGGSFTRPRKGSGGSGGSGGGSGHHGGYHGGVDRGGFGGGHGSYGG